MADRRYGPKPTPPFISDYWFYAVRCTGEPGTAGISCPRCKTSAALELTRDEIPRIGGQPVMVQIACEACQLLGVIVLAPPAATRPPASFLRDRPDRYAARAITAPPVADSPIAPEAATTERLTLSEWQALGVATELHPSTAAAIPRASDERPGRRSDDGRRLYTREEILAAVQRHSEQQRLHHQPPANTSTNNNNDNIEEAADHG